MNRGIRFRVHKFSLAVGDEESVVFDDDDFEHMSCSVVAKWGKIGMTEVRSCDHEDLKKCEIFS